MDFAVAVGEDADIRTDEEPAAAEAAATADGPYFLLYFLSYLYLVFFLLLWFYLFLFSL